MAEPNPMHDRVINDFTLHPPVSATVGTQMDGIRLLFQNLAHTVVDVTPQSREQSLAITNLEVALFYAIAAIARNQDA